MMSSIGLRRRHARLATAALTVALASGASTAAMAGAFGLREQSATGQGLSFAGMAAGGGDSISGMFWNPAVVNQVEHFQGEQHISAVLPSSDVTVSDATKGGLSLITGGAAATGDGGDIGKNAVLASGYNAYRLNDKVAIGLSINTPFGLATDPSHDWAGQLLNRSSKVLTVNAAPTIGYKVNEWFSVAAGVQIQYLDIRLRQALAITPGAPSATLRGDDVGVGFTAGFTVKPTSATEIGVGFRSKIEHNLEGKLHVFNPLTGGKLPSKIKADVTLPEMVSVGVRQQVTDELTLLAGGEWTNWSRLSTVKVKARGGPAAVPLPTLPFNYNDGWFLSGGAEYKFTPAFTGRAGVGYEWSPIDDKNRSARIPDDDRWWLSAGASYKYSEKIAFDLGYSYVFVPGKSDIKEAYPSPVPAAISFDAKAKSDVHIVSAALRYKFGGEAAPVLVTKY
ncbi:OmpP1/FadL family transporter [Hansschlegelia sp. KR7-227]|uniref:OmpP1/FadL family transporter n=1 Tax=Hansschlegelia sp. KR7-227 TaxID=3400914 RepID=UPI003C0E60E0